VPGGRFLDLYAGTGAVGIEAMSRGAATVTFVEAQPQALQLLRKNLTSCQLLDRTTVHAMKVGDFLDRPERWDGGYDVVFADPPYAARDAAPVILRAWKTGLVAPHGVMVIEQDAASELPRQTEEARLIRRYDYGDTSLFVYGPNAVSPTPS